MRTQRKFLLFFAAMASCAAAAHTTTLARMSLDQLGATADAVARVRCLGTESRWEKGAIWTLTTFNVVETMKGSLPSRVTVRLPGGRVGHLTATVDGTPKFNSGEEAVVFLMQSPEGGFSVAGWVEGTFRIALNQRTRRETVTQDSSAFAVFDAGTRTFRTEGIRGMPIEQFRARLSTVIARGEEKSR